MQRPAEHWLQLQVLQAAATEAPTHTLTPSPIVLSRQGQV